MQEPKADHRVFLNALLQVDAHVILCFRAAPKVEMRKVGERMEVVPKERVAGGGLDGWIPESDPALPYELTLSFLLMADAPGVPKPIKLPEDLRGYVPLNVPLDETVGRGLATWALGEEVGEEVDPVANIDEDPIAALHVIVRDLTDRREITPEQLRAAIAQMRNVPVDDDRAVLNWDTITQSEADAMLTRLRTFAASLEGKG